MAARRAPVRMSDVAKLAGVSIATVSNYFNKPEKLSAASRETVAAAVKQLRFVPNGVARALARGNHPVVGIVVLDLSNPFFGGAARGLEDRLAQAGIMLTVSSSDEDAARETMYLRLLEEHSVAGIVITPATASLRLVERIAERGTPVILLGRRQPDDAGLCAVTSDDGLGAAMIAKHLLELGHDRVVYVNGAGATRSLGPRREALRTTLEAAGAAFVELITPTMSIAGGELAARGVLEMATLPTAVVCANDLLALGVYEVLRDKGIRVPDDLALVGYDDADFSRSLSVPLTSVRQDRHALGFRAGDLLLAELCDDAHEHQELLFPPELVIRESTAGVGA
ncbi:MAG TPA: LacI family DNA-binding transcriptional regulator [Propionibacteriaceae bacterium]|nr:LacI family DNA-binding transcriptional regulator [Propionibacteriaceae bacterium]